MEVTEFLVSVAARALPRILTQICRDPDSTFYGCCDRDWWHYRIRDFPSIILQQAGYALALAANRSPPAQRGHSNALAAQTCRFWNARARRYGAFEEYYPWEQGYPPLAFSTLAVAKLCHLGVVAFADVEPGLSVAARQLTTRFESEAANQQVAGTAALAFIQKLSPAMVPANRFRQILDRTLALQTTEGWFPEYDGPDLGYLSVTMDCLWDIYDATGDERCRAAISAAADYIAWFVLGPVGGGGMHNSRNTDYIVPYGLVRTACADGQDSASASAVVSALYGRGEDDHFLNSVDDRYWCHYIGHSVFRALDLLQTSSLAPVQARVVPRRRTMPESGHASLQGEAPRGPSVLVSARKGAIFSAAWPQGERATDLGWIVRSGRRRWVSHWWSMEWQVASDDNEVECDGFLVLHRERSSTPWKHMALRAVSFLLGRRLIGLLKRVLIYKKSARDLRFARRVRCDGDIVVVEDRITGLRRNDELVRAPRASKRHVASANAYHPEDFDLLVGVDLTVERSGSASEQRLVTTYRPQQAATGGQSSRAAPSPRRRTMSKQVLP